VFANTDDMSHNLVITKPGAREQVVTEALKLGKKGPQMNYIPKSRLVLWSIPVLSPDQVKSIIFTAPKETVMPGYIYELSLGDIKTEKGEPLSNKLICYNLIT
jgi:hypothetical protein